MSVQLLDKTRKINKLLHNSSSSKVVFNDICQVLMETLSSNILVLSKKGKVLGVSLCPGVDEITELIEDKVGGYVDTLLNERFLGVLSTKENVNLQNSVFLGFLTLISDNLYHRGKCICWIIFGKEIYFQKSKNKMKNSKIYLVIFNQNV